VPHPNPGALADAANKNIWDVGFLGAEPQRANEIDFTAAYVEIESTYLVPAGSALKHANEVDRKGIRIIVPAKAAYELYLSRTINHAELIKEAGADASFKRFVDEKFDALAGLKPRLISDQAKLPGSVIVEGSFTAVQQAAGVPKGRANAAKYLAAFIEDVKASGLVAKAIAENQVVGLSIAALA
jgi:polar amino acid transport system substrate-binding protein